MPTLTEERRKELVKRARAEGENAKVRIRSQRKDANDMIKDLKNEGLSEDMTKSAEDEVQKVTDSYNNKVDTLARNLKGTDYPNRWGIMVSFLHYLVLHNFCKKFIENKNVL